MKTKLASYIIVAILGAASYHFLVGPRVETKIKTVEVVKTVTDVKKEIIKRPDGTIIVKEEHVVTSDSSKSSKNETKPLRNEYLVSVKKDLLHGSEWTGEIGRRVFSDLYVGAYYRTDNVAGLSLTFTF
jgi:hypothetical protein